MKTSAEIYQETISKLSEEEKRAIFPPKTMKNFVVRKSWYGRSQVITFKNKNGVEITYNHDIALDIMRPLLETKMAWDKYGYWSQSTDIPLILRHRDLMTPPKKVKK
jgi:hypothetical protein